MGPSGIMSMREAVRDILCSVPVRHLDIEENAKMALHRSDIEYVGELMQKSVDEVRAVLQRYGVPHLAAPHTAAIASGLMRMNHMLGTQIADKTSDEALRTIFKSQEALAIDHYNYYFKRRNPRSGNRRPGDDRRNSGGEPVEVGDDGPGPKTLLGGAAAPLPPSRPTLTDAHGGARRGPRRDDDPSSRAQP